MKTLKIALDDASLSGMIRDVMAKERAGADGRGTYLRTLCAGVQVEIAGAPVLAAHRGKVRAVSKDEALAALASVHGRFYSLVLAELDQGTSAAERNAKSGFARTAASTLRSALRTGLNPLSVPLPVLTKDLLRKWTRDHTEDEVPSVKAGLRFAKAVIRRLAALIQPMSEEDRAAVLDAVQTELNQLDAVVEYVPVEDHTRTHVIPTSQAVRVRRPQAELRTQA